MRKCNRKIKAPKYAFGAKEITGLLQAGGNIAQGFGTGNSTANAVFSGIDAVGDVASAINPIAGMAVKGVAGIGKMVTGIVGTKGSVDPVTGEITEGTGILGRKNKNKLKQRSGIVKNNIAAAENSQQLAADYYQEHGNNGVTLVADGGIIPNALAYLDDGELIRTPDGSINEIPEEGKPEDSNLMNVPVGTQVLSDKLKVPGTNKTFAQKGKEIMKTNKYKGNDKYAENSKMLNDRNAQIAYDNLLALQESLKTSKTKSGKINKYVYGTDEIDKNKNWNSNFNNQYKSIAGTRYANESGNYGNFNKMIDEWLKDDNNLNRAWNDLGNLPQVSRAMSKYNDKRKALHANYNDNKYGEVHDWFVDMVDLTKPKTFKKIDKTTPDFSVDIPDMSYIPLSMKTYVYNNSQRSQKSKLSTNVSDIISDLAGASAGLIGPIANMMAKRGETNVPYTYTPKYGPTEWNIDPQLREINRSNAIARYNQSRLSPNTGAGLAFGIQSAIARNDAMARAYAEKNNMENQMAMANAGIYNDAARYNAQARHTAAVENAQDRAAVDNARRLGLSQLGTALQTMSRDRRLTKRDYAMLNAMIPYLEYGIGKEQLTTLLNDLR